MHVTSHVDAEVTNNPCGGVSTSCVSIITSHIRLKQSIIIMSWQKADGGGVNWHFKYVVLH